MNTQFSELTDSQWEVIKDLFPIQRKRKYDLRNVVNAILWMLRTGCQWRNLDSKYPCWRIIYYYKRKFELDGTWQRLNGFLYELERWIQNREPLASMVSVDSQSVKVVPFCSIAKGVDGNKKVNGRKRHIIVHTMGLIIGVIVSAANLNDGNQAQVLFNRFKEQLKRCKKVLGDGAYQNGFDAWLTAHMSIALEVASRPQTARGFVPVKFRWVVERTFSWACFFRRLSKDYEKTVESSETWLLLMNCSIILSRMVPSTK